MTKRVINLTSGRERLFSSAVVAGEHTFLSGVAGSVNDKGEQLSGIEAQTRQCFENIKQILAAAKASLDDVVKVTIFLRNVEDFSKMNTIYKSYFSSENKPVRSTVIAGLVSPNMLLEIECVAYSPQH